MKGNTSSCRGAGESKILMNSQDLNTTQRRWKHVKAAEEVVEWPRRSVKSRVTKTLQHSSDVWWRFKTQKRVQRPIMTPCSVLAVAYPDKKTDFLSQPPFTARSQAFPCKAYTKRCGTNSTLISLFILGFLSLSSFFFLLWLQRWETSKHIQQRDSNRASWEVNSQCCLSAAGAAPSSPSSDSLSSGCKRCQIQLGQCCTCARRVQDRPQAIWLWVESTSKHGVLWFASRIQRCKGCCSSLGMCNIFAAPHMVNGAWERGQVS